jgi:hypothetical protein
MIPNLTAADVMDKAASYQNDANKTKYTYAAQMPFLNTAIQELEKAYALENMPVTDTMSTVLTIAAGVSVIGYAPVVPVGGTVYLPSNLVEPIRLWERVTGVNPYTPMTKSGYLIPDTTGIERDAFGEYAWKSNQIQLMAASRINDIKIEYTRALFTKITASTDLIGLSTAQTFLEYRTAALAAKFLGEDEPRSIELNGYAGLALDQDLGIGAKGRQNIMVRRRRFRAAYNSR